jgi:hypothetical protein
MTHTIEDTVARGMCIGCGACSVATNGAIPLTLGRGGMYSASLDGVAGEEIRRGSRVCPFSDDALDEDALGIPTDAGSELPSDPVSGTTAAFWWAVIARRIPDGQQFWRSHVVAARSAARTGPRRRRHPRRTHRRETANCSSTRSPGIRHRRPRGASPSTTDDFEGRLETRHGENRSDTRSSAFPASSRPPDCCAGTTNHSGNRSATSSDWSAATYEDQFFAESLAWQVGIAPHQLAAVDFRIKNPNRKASDYDFRALRSGANDYVQRRTQALVGGNYGDTARFNPRRATSATTSSPGKPQTSCSATRGCRATRTIGGARTSS